MSILLNKTNIINKINIQKLGKANLAFIKMNVHNNNLEINKNILSEKLSNLLIKKIFINIGVDNGILDLAFFIKFISDISKIDIGYFVCMGEIHQRSTYFEIDTEYSNKIIELINYIPKKQIINKIVNNNHNINCNINESINCKFARSSI